MFMKQLNGVFKVMVDMIMRNKVIVSVSVLVLLGVLLCSVFMVERFSNVNNYHKEQADKDSLVHSSSEHIKSDSGYEMGREWQGMVASVDTAAEEKIKH